MTEGIIRHSKETQKALIKMIGEKDYVQLQALIQKALEENSLVLDEAHQLNLIQINAAKPNGKGD